MAQKIDLTWQDVEKLAAGVRRQIFFNREYAARQGGRVYGVPNGGIPAALAVAHPGSGLTMTDDPVDADFIVDDIIDSGQTKERFLQYGKPFLALVDKKGEHKDWAGVWVNFPWELARREDGPEDAVRRLLQFVGEDPEREGLKETPARVVKSYRETLGGYGVDVADLFTTFERGTYDEMIVVRDIEFTSFCEHHWLPFHGVAHVGYVPQDRIIGLSKVGRLVDAYARRLQVQERLTTQVTEALMDYLKPRGAACVIDAGHTCMSCRGVKKQQARTVTSSLKGVFLGSYVVRAEFLSLIRG